MRPLVATVIILASAGCATFDAAECRSANWQEVGYRDGLAGLQWTTDIVYDGQCAKHGVTPDALAYRTGWQDGKWEYEKRAIRDSTD